MVDTKELEIRIEKSGYRKQYIAEQLGITIQALRTKTTNKQDFWCSEAEKLGDILQLSPIERSDIFFKKNVDKMTTNKVTA